MRRAVMAAAGLLASLVSAGAQPASSGLQVKRGVFSFPDHELNVRVTVSEDFQLCLWAQNVDPTAGAISIQTPPSAFRGGGQTGPMDATGLSVPPFTGLNLGCVGGAGGEEIVVQNSGGPRIVVFVTVTTAKGASVSMDREPARRP